MDNKSVEFNAASVFALISVMKRFDLDTDTSFEAACKEYKNLLAKAEELIGRS